MFLNKLHLGRKLARTLVLGITLAVSLGIASAGTLGIDYTNPGSVSTNGAWSLGYEFQALQSVSVTGLAFFTGGGISQNHDVGLWDSNGNLLASTTITSGSPVIGTGGFLWESIVPVILTAGDYYYVAGETGSDNYSYEPSGVTINPAISFVAAAYVSSGTLAFPDSTDPSTLGYFGGNVVLSTAAPEPSSMAMLLGGGMMLLGFVRRRTRLG